MNAALSNTMGRSQSGFVYDDERVKVTVVCLYPLQLFCTRTMLIV